MSEIDPIEFGKLINAVENLAKEVSSLKDEVDELKGKIHGARGMALGFLFAAGGVGAGAGHLLEKLFKG